MANQQHRVKLADSNKAAPQNATAVAPTNPEERFQVTVRVKRRSPLPPLAITADSAPVAAAKPRAQFEQDHGARPEDLDTIAAFAEEYGLAVVEKSVPRRSVILSGTAAQFSKAFEVQLHDYKHAAGNFRGRAGEISVPAAIAPIVEGVFGLDNRPFAHPHVRVPAAAAPKAAVPSGFSPVDLGKLYNFPANLTGKGQKIGIIELGGGFRPAELQTYFTGLGIAPPTVTVASYAGGGSNSPGTDAFDPANPDVEILLDIEVAGAVAPGAAIVVYFAPDASDQSFLNAITAAVHDSKNHLSVISISWGGPESTATAQFQNSFDQALQSAAHLNITVCVASGDNGSADSPANDPSRPWDKHAHVDFPASSPFALACGGTHITAAGGKLTAETVWHDGLNDGSGGGVSRVFALPAYQANAKVPKARNPTGAVKRGVPDVAADAAPSSGYQILCDGQRFPDPAQNVPPVGGTSAVAPLWAGLIARLNEGLGAPLGFVHPRLYQAATAFHDITSGNNGDYKATSGWDPCTGLGTPDGTKLLAALGKK